MNNTHCKKGRCKRRTWHCRTGHWQMVNAGLENDWQDIAGRVASLQPHAEDSSSSDEDDLVTATTPSHRHQLFQSLQLQGGLHLLCF